MIGTIALCAGILLPPDQSHWTLPPGNYSLQVREPEVATYVCAGKGIPNAAACEGRDEHGAWIIIPTECFFTSLAHAASHFHEPGNDWHEGWISQEGN
jgi:hypothetical protein